MHQMTKTLCPLAWALVDDDAAVVAGLVARAAEGDRHAYDALVERYGRLVWHIARSAGLDATDAADVSQTVWLRFVEQITRLRDPARAGAWLATTARRECATVSRRRARSVPIDLVEFEDRGGLPVVDPVDASALEAADRAAAVRLAFASLPERCRNLLRLLCADPPVRYKVVAEALDLAVGSIGPKRQRCLEQLASHPAIACITEGGRASSQGMEDAS